MNILEKLNNIDIKDLQKIDVSQIIFLLKTRIDLSIILAIVIVTVFIGIKIPMGIKTERAQLTSRISKLSELLEAKKRTETIDAQHKKAFDEFPESLEINKLGKKISEIAIENNVQILAFSPSGSIEDSNKKISIASLDISSASYSDLVNFIKSVDLAPYAFRLKSMKGLMSKQRSSKKQKMEKDKPIQIYLDIETVELKKDEKNK